MPASHRSKNTPVWRTDVRDVLADLHRLDADSVEHYVTLSPLEVSLILREIESLEHNKCPVCRKQMSNLQVICSKCFEERQGSS
jgi:hypothetical protein